MNGSRSSGRHGHRDSHNSFSCGNDSGAKARPKAGRKYRLTLNQINQLEISPVSGRALRPRYAAKIPIHIILPITDATGRTADRGSIDVVTVRDIEIRNIKPSRIHIPLACARGI